MSGPTIRRGESKQDYQTPTELIDAIKARLNIREFDVDLAATKENSVSPYECITEEMDSLAEHVCWYGYGQWAWLNPPYANIAPWVQKAQRESKRGAHIVMLVPASVGAKWWKEWVESHAYVSFLCGRLTFVGCTTPYPKDCALLFYTPWGFRGSEIWDWRVK